MLVYIAFDILIRLVNESFVPFDIYMYWVLDNKVKVFYSVSKAQSRTCKTFQILQKLSLQAHFDDCTCRACLPCPSVHAQQKCVPREASVVIVSLMKHNTTFVNCFDLLVFYVSKNSVYLNIYQVQCIKKIKSTWNLEWRE